MATPEKDLDYGDVPDWVTEDDIDIEVGDLSAVQDTSFALETTRNVLFEIRKASLDTQEYKQDDGSKLWAKRNLHLQLNIASDGVDGEGRYANKAFFVNLLLQVNREGFPDAFKYEKFAVGTGKAFLTTKQFYKAMGGDVAKINVTKAYRDELVGRTVKADIIRREKRAATGETDAAGKAIWAGTGEFENSIENFKAAE